MNKKIQLLIGCLLMALTAHSSIENENDNQTYIIGHWNYPPNSVNPIYVISDAEDVELFINGISNGHGRHESKYLFTFDNVIFQPGTLTAVSYDADGKEQSQYSLNTSGVPAQLKLTVMNPVVINESDDSEEMVIHCEVTDFYGKRCFQDNRTVFFEIEELKDKSKTSVSPIGNYNHKKQLRLNKGENFISVKKPSKSGEIKITAKTPGFAPSYVILKFQ